MAHAIQQSSDTADQFAGVMIHDATMDIHRDVFGGANWDNDVWVGVVGANPGPPRLPAGAALNIKHFIHTVAPHGEARGPDLGPKNVSVLAPPAALGPAALIGGLFAAKDHGDHEDALLGLIVAIANGGLIRASGLIVLAVHHVPGRQFLYVTDVAGDAETVTGAAAILLDLETGAGSAALCLFGPRRSDLKAVALHAGGQSIDLPDPQQKMDEVKGIGMAGLHDFQFDPGAMDTGGGGIGTGLGITAQFKKDLRWEAGLVPAETFAVSDDLAGGCRPASAKATKWGPWNGVESEADKAAFEAAREAAGKACHGTCGDSKNCKYTEQSAELLETETRGEEGRLQYRSKVRSEGKCECQ